MKSLPRLHAVILTVMVTFIFPHEALATAKVVSGSTCPKPNFQQEFGGKLFTCLKSGSKLRWDKGVIVKAPTQSVTPSPASSATFKPLFILDVKPVLTMTTWSEIPSYFVTGGFKRWVVTPGYVEISLPAFDKTNPEAEYFVVIENNWVFSNPCTSGDVSLPIFRRKIEDRSSSKLEVAQYSKSYREPSQFFKIPAFPITFRCSYVEKKSYSIQVFETFTSDRRIRAVSSKLEFVTPELQKPIEVTPSPTPTLNSGVVVVPNALCSPEGASGKFIDGSMYTCQKTSNDGVLRWTK